MALNSVILIGRTTVDPDVRYGAQSQTAVCKFNIALDRGKDRNGNDMGADFPSVTVFGKTAENCGKYLKKGRLVAIQGKIRTGKYEKDGKVVYTTDVYADRVEFLEWGDKKDDLDEPTNESKSPEGFNLIGDDIPF